jgi:hypothetical protein
MEQQRNIFHGPSQLPEQLVHTNQFLHTNQCTSAGLLSEKEQGKKKREEKKEFFGHDFSGPSKSFG